MRKTSTDVRVWAVRPRKNKSGKATSYGVEWRVGPERHYESRKTRAHAESFRSELVSAASRGEAFLIDEPGLPVSMAAETERMSWLDFAQRYIDLKWPRAAAKSRAGNADTLATVTPLLLASDRGRPDPKVLRKALTGWAFNTKRRDADKPPEVAQALRWVAANTVQVSRLEDPELLRRVLEQLASKMDGKPASAKTFGRKRSVFHNALEYAVELRVLDRNLLPQVKWTPPKEVKAIDKRVVINPGQARRLLAAVGDQFVEGEPRRSSGPGLVAYFAAMYYAGLRPEEAAMLRKADLQLPEEGWGELLLSGTAPTAGAAWTDSGQRRDRRHLKQRGAGEVRPVPCPPPLTGLLHAHLARFSTAPDGRLFRSLTGGDLAESTTARVWDKARKAALTAEEYASPLAKRPYDLRHACVSTWLGGGVQSTQVAEWAGHSVAVLHQIYAKVLVGQEASARQRIEAALNQDG
ncbi:tyrosine-type recombinase/integrase, partial [Saccharopolyspora sp. CA-218241]|uniref:tyrosine-type recombinase/integrase n=1 Tax=Saccharopolyspora sp. CA-218241 TaxID=3240027 RepID=UPI003D96A3E2